MSSGVMAPLPKDDPMLIAWEEYKATEDYANTKKWAADSGQVDGSLWTVFMQGYIASKK